MDSLMMTKLARYEELVEVLRAGPQAPSSILLMWDRTIPHLAKLAALFDVGAFADEDTTAVPEGIAAFMMGRGVDQRNLDLSVNLHLHLR